MEKNKIENKKLKIVIRWLVLAIVFFIVLAGLIFWFEKNYENKIYPGVKIGYLDVSGQTQTELFDKLKGIEKNVQEKGLVFKSSAKEISINPIVISSSPDLAQRILIFDWPQTVESAFAVGRSSNFLQNLISQGKSFLFGKEIAVSFDLDQKLLLDHLKASFSEQEKIPVNASLKIVNGEVEITGEQSGRVFDYQTATNQLVENISDLNFEPISLSLEFKEPEIKKQDTGSAVNSMENILQLESITLRAEPYWWKLNQSQFIDWLEFQIVDGEVALGLNKESLLEFLEPIANQINVEAQDAKFKLSGNRVTEFQSSRDGQTLNFEKSYEKINKQIMLGGSDDIELVVDVNPAKVATSDLNDLGIKELLGRGVSNFSGSPVNRRHNIATGADSLDGILIAPGEEFSLLDALGEIDGENGYLQELVIKGDRTIPEYGGGLCQIGTTTFRAALRSGLPVTARRNHSYRVVYYEPAGMDATIYDPAPDMKFLNDTGNHILFIAKIDGNELIFEFYGTPDGRKVTIDPDPPSIYNITPPGPPRYIETEDLPPGEKKKVESAHFGADTYFKYTIEYADGEIKEQDFYSHYVPWPEVWLVGKDSSSTSTEEIVEATAAN